jgi:hypothetical protein
MKSRYSFITLALFIITLLIFILGCSRNISNPVMTDTQSGNYASNPGSLPIIGFDGTSATGLLGAYTLIISPDLKTAELVPMRSTALGESFIVSGIGFFTVTPCPDCLMIDRLEFVDIDTFILGMKVKHPFPKGNISLPPSAKNRLDLDVFDLALVLAPTAKTPTNYVQIGTPVYDGIMENADGYTRELQDVVGNSSAMPYKICYEKSNNNRFTMGTNYQPFDLVLTPGLDFYFDMYLTMGYGASAKKFQRLNPVYYVPEFNRKAAWKVNVTPPDVSDTWLEGDTTTPHDVLIDIYDWNHGATVATIFPDPAHTDRISADSDVDTVTVEVPGMTSGAITAITLDPTSNGWDDPLTYTASFANENNLPAGEYTGLVKVTDTRIPAGPDEDDFVYSWGITWNQNDASPTLSYSAEVDGAGNIFISGEFIGTFDFDPGPGVDIHTSSGNGQPDAFLKKFTTTGDYLWGVSWGDPGSEWDCGLTLDNAGNVFVIGTFEGTVDFDPGPGSTVETAFGESDVYMVKFDTNGNFRWVDTWGSDYLEDFVWDVDATSTGVVCVVGTFTGMTDFEPGPFQDLYIAEGMHDIYLNFLSNSDGEYIGVYTWGGLADDSVNAVEIDSGNNIYVLGMFEAAVDFNPLGGEDWYVSAHYPDSPFLTKFGPGGTYLWTRTWGTDSGWCKGYDMTCDSDGNTYITGTFTEAVDLDPGAGIDHHNSNSTSADIYLTKLDPNGNFLHSVVLGGSQPDCGVDVATDDDGYVYMTGFFTGGVDFDEGPESHPLASVGPSDPFLTKYDESGNYVYAYSLGNAGDAWGSGIVLDNSGDIYLTGIFTGSIDLDPSDYTDKRVADDVENRFLAKYRTSGIASEGQADSLVHTPDGYNLWWRYMPEYATYQTFKAVVNN